MADIPTAKEITDLISLLAPGLIIVSIRSRAITGSAPEFKDRLVAYGLISVGYYAAVAPLFHIHHGLALPAWLWSFLQYFAVPLLVGIGSAYAHQHRLTYRVAELARLHLAHHLPAAWDYTFQSLPAGTFILVRLTDGTEVPGRMGKNSFASSSREERDLLIEELWEIDSSGAWAPSNPPRNVLLCGKDIRTTEIF